MYFFYICSLTNDCKKMKKKLMNVCGVALLDVSLLACSGQKKGAEATESASDAVKVTAEATSAQADSTGYIVRIGEMLSLIHIFMSFTFCPFVIFEPCIELSTSLVYELLPSHIIICFIPVSYTHLQRNNRRYASICCVFNYELGMYVLNRRMFQRGKDNKYFWFHEQSNTFFSVKTVSYTHLDVYKRQVCFCCSSSILSRL